MSKKRQEYREGDFRTIRRILHVRVRGSWVRVNPPEQEPLPEFGVLDPDHTASGTLHVGEDRIRRALETMHAD